VLNYSVDRQTHLLLLLIGSLSRRYEAHEPPIEHLKPSEDMPLSGPRTEAVKKFTYSRVHLLGLDKNSDKTEVTIECSLNVVECSLSSAKV
jgi:hypothetical protein